MRKNFKLLLLVLALAALFAPASALAAAPAATTQAASEITSTQARLNGSVDPGRETTKFHFEYGTTTAYGAQTPEDQVVPRGNKAASASEVVGSLQPSTTYHFRLVASNASGSSQGADMTFTTLAEGQVPPGGGNAVTIAAAPVSVLFGRATTISGQVTGDGADKGVEMTLQAQPAGATDFTNVATTTAAPTGAYTFTQTPLVNTRYRVEAKASPKVTSPVVAVSVRKAVSFKLSDSTPKRGSRVRFSGTVKPSHDGLFALIQKKGSGGKFRTVAKAQLKASKTAGVSKYSKRLRIRRTGVYRVRVAADADHARGTSRKRRVRVH